MSRIDELIAEHCPDGVSYRPLGEIAELVRGNGMPRADFVEAGVGCIHYGQIYTYYGTSAASTISFVPAAKAAKLAKVDPGDLIITNTSENPEDVGKAVAWLGDEQIVTGGHATVIKHRQDPKFLAYWFQSREFQVRKKKFVTGTKVMDVSAKNLARIEVPVPPLAVQREIAAILDKMERLEAELEAELEARRRQYEYYRMIILENGEAGSVALGSLGKWYGGMTPSKANSAYWDGGTIPWLASMDLTDTTATEIRGKVTEKALSETPLRTVPAPAVAVVMRSNILRRILPVGLTKVDTTLNQDVRALVPANGVDAEYVYQAVMAAREDIRASCVRTDGSMAAVDSRNFFAYEIPLPSFTEQQRVVQKLRAFDALANDLTSGLPAEIAARRKQYEYYRGQLLTFKEAA